MDSSPDRLTPLQRELLIAFFSQERRFFLTGGAALAGFWLCHRETDDLDLFTHDKDAFEAGTHALVAAAEAVGARLSVRQDAPGFRRIVVSRGHDEAVVVALVWERVASAYPDKVERGAVRIDPAEEILINKLTTVLSRSEERDVVDLLFLERMGLRVEGALDAALEKDGGCTPAALAFVLSEVAVPEAVTGLPGGVTPSELRGFIADLVVRLRRAAMP